MPMYYFHLRDQDQVTDIDGTDLADDGAARLHANTVARELMFNSDNFMGESWSHWSMVVHDSDGEEVFAFELSDLNDRNSK